MPSGDDPITAIQGIGKKTAEELRQRVRSRGTRKKGEIKVKELKRARPGGQIDALLGDAQKQKAANQLETKVVNKLPEGSRSSGASKSKLPDGFASQGDFLFEKGQRKEAFQEFNDLGASRKEEDKDNRARVTTDLEEWEDNISGLDFPGVDTPRRKPREKPKDIGFTVSDLDLKDDFDSLF